MSIIKRMLTIKEIDGKYYQAMKFSVLFFLVGVMSFFVSVLFWEVEIIKILALLVFMFSFIGMATGATLMIFHAFIAMIKKSKGR